MIDTPQPADFTEWSRLYAAYADFYKVPQTDDMRACVWGWIMDPQAPVQGFVARAPGQDQPGGSLIGLAHFRAFSRPLTATTGGFLDDLFVDPAQRGAGTARRLIAAVRDQGRASGWSVVRWITAADNRAARGLYDQVAQATPWVTYDLRP